MKSFSLFILGRRLFTFLLWFHFIRMPMSKIHFPLVGLQNNIIFLVKNMSNLLVILLSKLIYIRSFWFYEYILRVIFFLISLIPILFIVFFFCRFLFLLHNIWNFGKERLINDYWLHLFCSWIYPWLLTLE